MSLTNKYRDVVAVPANVNINWPGRRWIYSKSTNRWQEDNCVDYIRAALNTGKPGLPGGRNAGYGSERFSFAVWLVREHNEPEKNELGEVAP